MFRECNNSAKSWTEVYSPAICKEKITNPLTKLIVQTRLEEQMALNTLKRFRNSHIPTDNLSSIYKIFSEFSLRRISVQQQWWEFKMALIRNTSLLYYYRALNQVTPICEVWLNLAGKLWSFYKDLDGLSVLYGNY